jgi:hypothetical protein
MPNAIEAQIKSRISEFVQELDLLVRKSALEALQGVLTNGAAPARRGRGPGRPRGSGNVDSAASAIVAYVGANDGQGVSQIAAGSGVALKLAKKVIAKLIASGQLKKTGQKRGTVYHIGSGRAPRAKTGKRGKRRGRKAKAA